MEVVNFPNPQNGHCASVGARGACPHCTDKSLFNPVASAVFGTVVVSVAQCQSCKDFVLVKGSRQGGQGSLTVVTVFPLGKPDERVDPAIPAEIASDFQEALRCYFIKSYKATVVMCGRALQSSVLDLNAEGKRLVDQIDNLQTQGKITQALKEFAHEIRLVRNDGAHPDKDGLADVTEHDAKDVISFTTEFFHHVYVMPAKLKARKTPPNAATSIPEQTNSNFPGSLG